MGVKSLNTELCDGCGVCIEDCPTDVFKIDTASGKAYVAYPGDCVECLLCEKTCPPKAIKISLAAAEKLFFPY